MSILHQISNCLGQKKNNLFGLWTKLFYTLVDLSALYRVYQIQLLGLPGGCSWPCSSFKTLIIIKAIQKDKSQDTTGINNSLPGSRLPVVLQGTGIHLDHCIDRSVEMQ